MPFRCRSAPSRISGTPEIPFSQFAAQLVGGLYAITHGITAWMRGRMIHGASLAAARMKARSARNGQFRRVRVTFQIARERSSPKAYSNRLSHLGGFVTAAAAQVPVLPVAIRCTRAMLRDGQ